MTPVRGDVWPFDLGMAEKVRPALVISVAFGEADRALVTIVPHTTSLRGSQFEIPVSVPFLKAGAFVVQGLSTYPKVRAIRKLGVLKPEQFRLVFAGVLRWLGQDQPPGHRSGGGPWMVRPHTRRLPPVNMSAWHQAAGERSRSPC